MPPATQPIRVPISINLLGNDYTGRMYVGSQRKEVNLLLDTGSSTLAVQHRHYDPVQDTHATLTHLVQEVAYVDGSKWIGSVVHTHMATAATGDSIDLHGVPVAVAYHASASMFGKSQGILGLAYRKLNNAFNLQKPTVPPGYSPNDVQAGLKTFVNPYFTQLEEAGLVPHKFALYTRRSTMRASADAAADPLNNGWLILGGGEEATDLYAGTFQTAVVLSDDYYSVNLKQVVVGGAPPIAASPPPRHSDSHTNAFVDSGTSGIALAPEVFDALLATLSADQVKRVRARQANTADLVLGDWPTLTLVLEGDGEDIRLDIRPPEYWQMDAWEAGTAVCALWRASGAQSVLGLPLLNSYFTVFDRSAHHGLGALKFAAAK